MTRLLPRFIAVAFVCACALTAGPARASSFVLGTSNPDESHVGIDVRFTNDYPDSVEYPNVTGFDVVRRKVSDCSANVLLTVAPIPRQPGNTQFTLLDTPPEQETAYEYRAIAVDVNRNTVLIHRGYSYVSEWSIASSPSLSAPAVFGTVRDWGWTQYIEACDGTCWRSAYVGSTSTNLASYIGQTVMVFGGVADGSIEGAYVAVDHVEAAPCPTVVPTRATSWGRLKMLYR